MIPALVVAAVALAALAYVAAPLRRSDESRVDESLHAADLVGRKRAALTAILDMEDERDAGKLSTVDFAALRREYEAEAAAALAELDALRAGGGTVDESLEAEIAEIRARLQEDAPRAEPSFEACPTCGTPRVPGRTCERCGT